MVMKKKALLMNYEKSEGHGKVRLEELWPTCSMEKLQQRAHYSSPCRQAGAFHLVQV